MSKQRSVPALISAAAAAAMVLAACTAGQGGDNKAGGSAEPVVLTMADAYTGFHYEPAVQYFVDQVEEISDGALRIDASHEVGDHAADAEQQVVRGVASADFDVAWVGTRVFDTLGVNSFRALSAPMLIDSYPLQQAVIESDIPAEMMAGLDKAGVTGIAVLGDRLRKPIAVDHPLLSPADYRGITFQSFRSTTQADAIRALDAKPIDVFAGDLDKGLIDGGIHGFEKSLHAFQVNETLYLAPYVTANVNLWPQTVALIANPDTLDDLTDSQRDWLMQAGAAAAERSTDLADRDAATMAQLCQAGARFADASDADLAALREAFAHVYSTLEQDSETKQFIARINDLKDETDPGPGLEIPADCTGPAPIEPPASSETANGGEFDAQMLEGVYRWTVTEDDARANGDRRLVTPELLRWYPMIGTLTLDNGTWEVLWRGAHGDEATDGPGTYAVEGDRIALELPGDPISPLTFSFTTDDDGNVDVEPITPMEEAEFIFAHYQWEKIAGGTEQTSDDQGALDGVYRWALSEKEILAEGLPNPDEAAINAGIWTWTLKDGHFEFDQRGPNVTDHREGSYEITGDQIEFFIPDEPPDAKYLFIWELDGDGSIQLTAAAGIDSLAAAIFTTKTWDRIGEGPGENESPTDAAALNGTYRWTANEDGAPVIITAFLQDGAWGSSSTGDPHDADGPTDADGIHGTYVVDGDRITFHNVEYDEETTAIYTIDEDGNLRWSLPPPRTDPGGDELFFSETWIRIG
jgi:TRAP-type C4-dicarboxylate transport system substrate-binding protein